MNEIKFKDKKITVMGLGLHGGGLAVAKFLAKRGAIVTVTDLKTAKQLAKSIKQLRSYKIKYVLGKHDLADFVNADMVIKNPGVHGRNKFLEAARKHKVKIETDLSLFFQLCPSNKTIGITGTKGKSTTASLVYQIIKAYKKAAILGGNIRISPLDYLEKVKADTPVVLELSSWQLEGLKDKKISPHYALVANVLRDHLNTYKNMADYAAAKALIFKSQRPEDFIILNKDNDYTKAMAKQVKSKLGWYSLKKLPAHECGSYPENGWLVFKNNSKKEKVIAIKDVRLQGEHNLSNILAAIALTKIFGAPTAIIRKAVKNFKGIEGRLQLIREFQGVKYYNDTTATTPDAVMAALNSFDQKVALLAGGTDKKLEFKKLAKMIKAKARVLILFEGSATDKLVKELRKINYNENLVFVESMKEAFKQAKYILQKGDVFLLSPGAASFGLFINEFDRGDQFNEAVKKLAPQGSSKE
jgi:UDP-N-acetylmuramoylalanine--D-glutamate ligase